MSSHRLARAGRQASLARRGVIIVFVALLLPLIMFVAATAVDMAYLRSARTELQNTADATAKAAIISYVKTQNVEQARAAALEIAEKNYVAGQPFRLDPQDVMFGTAAAVGDGFDFAPNEITPNAVRVFARRTVDSAAGPISLFFGKSFGHVNVEMVRASMAQVGRSDVIVVLDRGRTMAFGAKESSKKSNPDDTKGKLWKWCSKLKKDSRFMLSKQAIEQALLELEANGSVTQVALVTFGNQAIAEVDFTQDYSLIRARLEAIASSYCEEDVEQIAEAVALAADLGATHESKFAAEGRQVISVLLTDDGLQFTDPVPAAASSLKAGVPVDVLSFSDEANGVAMKNIATAGGGAYQHAIAETDLNQKLNQMLQHATEMQLVNSSNSGSGGVKGPSVP